MSYISSNKKKHTDDIAPAGVRTRTGDCALCIWVIRVDDKHDNISMDKNYVKFIILFTF